MKSILDNIENISREDRMFLDILEIGTKKDVTHYEVPLPFRNIGIQLPDNKNQAVKRMHHPKRRFSSLTNIKDKWKSLSNQIMASYGISHIMLSSIQAHLESLELFSTAVSIMEELH